MQSNKKSECEILLYLYILKNSKFSLDTFTIIYECKCARIISTYSSLIRAAMALSEKHWASHGRVCVGGLPSKTWPLGACKIRRGGNVFQVAIQNCTSEIPKRRSHSLRSWPKLWWHVSGISFEMSPRSSAIAHCIAVV